MPIQPLLTRLDELEKSATTGPWYIEKDDSLKENDRFRLVPFHEIKKRKEQDTSMRPNYCATVYSQEDAEFISIIRNAYPTLRAEIERLQEVERKYNEMMK